MPLTHTALRETPVTLMDPDSGRAMVDHLGDPMERFDGLRQAELSDELAALGSGHAPTSTSDDPVRSDLRAMAADPVFGRGKMRYAGLERPEEADERAAKAERQDAWEARKGEGSGPGLLARGMHKLDKRTGRGGLDLATRYAAKSKRAVKQTGHLGPVGVPGYTGKGAKSFFDSGGMS
jgi:hypothetical protein